MTHCTLIAKPNPFGADRVYAEAQAGQTLAQMLGEAAHSCAVTVGGYDVPRALWDRVRPKAGQMIHVTVYPQGGSGGKVLRTILMVVVMVVAMWVTGGGAAGMLGSAFAQGTMGAALAGMAVGMVGMALVNALVPPPSLKSGGAGDPYDPLQQITGTQNRAVPYGVIPCVIGQARLFPPHAALPFTEISGNDQYIRMMLDLGYGDLDVSDIRIGDTPIGQYHDVEWEVTKTPTLFTQDIFELDVGVTMNETGDIAIRTSQNPSNELAVDLIFPAGLYATDSKGKTKSTQVVVTIKYRAVGATIWQNATQAEGLSISTSAMQATVGSFTARSSEKKLLRAGVRWRVPVGQYEVQVERLFADKGDSPERTADMMSWSLLRSISAQNPSDTGTTKLAVRIKATDQLNGMISTLSCVVAQRVRRMDEDGNWLPPVSSNNPAWVWLWLLTECPATVRRLPDDRIDLIEVAQWAAECEAKDYVIGTVADSARQLGDLLRDVLACGRASFGDRNGKYSPVRDIAQAVPAQMFTPANSWDFAYSRAFIEPPHALRVTFRNPDNNQQDVRTVYWDGFNADNATRFEELDLRMVDQPDAAWRLGRYHLAVMWHRPTQYTLNADIENIVVERGDLIHVASDVTAWGMAWGRIIAVDGAVVTLDNQITLEAGKSYNFRVRGSDNFQEQRAITTSAGEHDVITLASPGSFQPGDLWIAGEVDRGVAALIVRSKEYGDEMTARLVCVDAAPIVWTADAGTPPPFVSEITGQPWCSPPEPPSVSIRPGNSAPDDSGVIHPQPGIGSPMKPGIERSVVATKDGGKIKNYQEQIA